jgi:hypothetical protein
MTEDAKIRGLLETKPFPERLVWLLLAALWLLVFALRLVSSLNAIGDDPGAANLASGLLDGLAASPWSYQYAQLPGTMVFGILLYPVYAICGSSLLWIEILGALFLAGGVVFWTLAVRRAWQREVAPIFFLWLIFPPPFLEANFHSAKASHVENLFFSGLLVFLFVRRGSAAPRFWETLGFSLLAGFAVFFYQGNIAICLALAATAVWRWGRSGAWRLLWPAAPAFLLGYWPSRYSRTLPFAFNPFYHHTIPFADCWSKWADFFSIIAPRWAGYTGFGGHWLSLAWPLLAIFGIAFAVRHIAAGELGPFPGDWLARLLAAQLFFFFVAYGFSEWTIPLNISAYGSLRYLVSISLSVLAFACYFLQQTTRRWKWLLLAPFLLAGGVNVVRGVDFSAGGLAHDLHGFLARRGDDYAQYVYFDLPREWKTHADAAASIAKLPRRWRDDGYVSLGIWLPPEELAAVVQDESLPPAARRYLALGGAIRWTRHVNAGAESADARNRRAAALSRLKDMDRPIAQSFAAGVGRGLGEQEEDMIRKAAETANSGEPNWENLSAQAGRIRDWLPQLTDREFILAVFEGFGLSSGLDFPSTVDSKRGPDLGAERLEQAIVRQERLAGIAPGGEADEVFRQGFTAGLAAWIKNRYKRFDFSRGGVDPAAMASALSEQGVRLRRCAGQGGEYDLDLAK